MSDVHVTLPARGKAFVDNDPEGFGVRVQLTLRFPKK